MTKILAPAGSEETVYAAFEAGAEAVYVGPKDLSRRPSQYEMDDDGLHRCIEYAKAHGKEIHIPVNVFYQASHIPVALGKIAKYVDWDVDVLILADLGLIQAVHKEFPDTRLCVSIGCGISNAEAAKFYKELGCSQFVAQVNITPDEVRRIKREVDIEVEVFSHGHFDFNQCGRCWMSTYVNVIQHSSPDGQLSYPIGSVNRGGGCLRVCRLPWTLYNDQGKVLRQDCIRGNYHFYYSLDQLADFVKVGVAYFKMQDRTYNTRFIARMTRMYRKLLDEIAQSAEAFEVKDEFRVEAERLESERAKQFDERTRNLHGLALGVTRRA